MLDSRLAATLMERAEAAAARAYCPYSGFPVGAALLTASGEIFDGANIENASYSITNCAERTALFAAVFAGHRAIAAIAVATPRAPGGSPCGACRQALNEFRPADQDMAIVLGGTDGLNVIPLSALLPHAFGPRDLEVAGPTPP